MEDSKNETKKPAKISLLRGALAAKKPVKEEPPVRRRLMWNEATPEKLHELMAENPEGLLMISDELGSWLSAMQKPGRELERGLMLEAWDGNSSRSIDRIGRGTTEAEALCASVLGAIQPDNLQEFMDSADLTIDGLLQRFQVLVYPDKPRKYEQVDRVPDQAAADRVDKLFRCLVRLKAGSLTGRFSADGQELFNLWLTDLEERLLREEDSKVMQQHLGKYRSLMPTLAMLFELADIGGVNGFEGFEPLVGKTINVGMENTQRAVEWCQYLESHARRVYSLVEKREVNAAAVLTDHIKERRIGSGGSFTRNELIDKNWKGLNDAAMADKAIQTLIEHHWIRAARAVKNLKGGRPTVHYNVNPRIWEE